MSVIFYVGGDKVIVDSENLVMLNGKIVTKYF